MITPGEVIVMKIACNLCEAYVSNNYYLPMVRVKENLAH